MATPGNGLPENPAELTPQQIADQIAAATAASQPGGEPSQLQREYVVETSTGAVFRGRTQQEVIDAMKKSVEHGSETIKQLKAQLEQQAMPPYVQEAPGQPVEGWNPQRYYEIWAQDPDAAEDYRLRVKHGIDMAQFAQEHQQAYQFAAQLRPEVITKAWMSTSDFPTSNPEEMEKAANAFEGVWNEFYPGDLDITPQKLEQVHAVALKRGLYQPEQSQTGPVAAQQFQNAPANPFPTLNTGGGATTGPQQDVNRMTPEQIRGLMEQFR